MDALELADYREAVARLYLSPVGLDDFRAARDELFARHPQSPIPVAERAGFPGLRYFPGVPELVVEVPLRARSGRLGIDTGGPDGLVSYERVGVLDTPWGPLSLWWIAAYGGGRYLTDTVKGTHGRGLQVLSADRVRLDFNYLYNPSCAYDSRWACPLAPRDNWLDVELPAGELTYH